MAKPTDNKLKKLLKKRGMTQADLAKAVEEKHGVAQSTVHRAARTGDGHLDTWLAIAKVLGVNVSDIAD